jgi:hypothetical protein
LQTQEEQEAGEQSTHTTHTHTHTQPHTHTHTPHTPGAKVFIKGAYFLLTNWRASRTVQITMNQRLKGGAFYIKNRSAINITQYYNIWFMVVLNLALRR